MRQTSNVGHRTRQSISWIEIVLLAAVIGTLVGAAVFSGHKPSGRLLMRPVQVSAGDSLWTLAAQYPVDGQSTAQTVEVIVERNHLSGVALAIGSTIQVPADPLVGAMAAR